jgi:pyruvate dehydrogenase E1 component
MRIVADQIRPFVHAPFKVLGTDGFGRSDNREMLRHFFEVNRYFVTVAALKALADAGEVEGSTVTAAMKKYGIDPQKPNPVTV